MDEANHIIGCVGFARDITERKQAEASLGKRTASEHADGEPAGHGVPLPE